MKRLLLALLLAPAAVHASNPADYAWQWPIELDPQAPAHRLTLTEAVYPQISDPALRDLEAFNGAGEPLPFGPLPAEPGSQRPGERWSVSWFALPAERGDSDPARIRLQIERDADGRLRRLDADIPDGAAASAPADLLLDLGEPRRAIERIDLEWRRDGDRVARFRVAASDDLTAWSTLRNEVRLLDLEQGPHRLLRQRIDLPASNARYLLLARLDDGPPLALTAIEAAAPEQIEANGAMLQWTELTPEPDPRQPGHYRYRVPGPLPISQLAVGLASSNSVATVTLSSRDHAEAGWRQRNRHTAFRIDAGDSLLDSDPQSIDLSRDRDWLLQAEPPLDRPPTLRVGWRPDRFALLARGDGPYRLAAGSHQAHRADYPLAVLLDGLRARGGDWQLPDARLGPGTALAGDAALARPWPIRQWLLWAVLLAGAALVIGMVLKLARQA